jgi:hypothetical protein
VTDVEYQGTYVLLGLDCSGPTRAPPCGAAGEAAFLARCCPGERNSPPADTRVLGDAGAPALGARRAPTRPSPPSWR